jgi:hypothetical protein
MKAVNCIATIRHFMFENKENRLWFTVEFQGLLFRFSLSGTRHRDVRPLGCRWMLCSLLRQRSKLRHRHASAHFKIHRRMIFSLESRFKANLLTLKVAVHQHVFHALNSACENELAEGYSFFPPKFFSEVSRSSSQHAVPHLRWCESP